MEENEQVDWDTLISLAQELADLGTSIKQEEAKAMEERAVRELICGLCDDCHEKLNVCSCVRQGAKIDATK